MFVLNLARFLTHCTGEWRSAPISKQTNLFRQSSRSYIVFTLTTKQTLPIIHSFSIFLEHLLKLNTSFLRNIFFWKFQSKVLMVCHKMTNDPWRQRNWTSRYLDFSALNKQSCWHFPGLLCLLFSRHAFLTLLWYQQILRKHKFMTLFRCSNIKKITDCAHKSTSMNKNLYNRETETKHGRLTEHS